MKWPPPHGQQWQPTKPAEVQLTWMKSTNVHGRRESSWPMSLEKRLRTRPEVRTEHRGAQEISRQWTGSCSSILYITLTLHYTSWLAIQYYTRKMNK